MFTCHLCGGQFNWSGIDSHKCPADGGRTVYDHAPADPADDAQASTSRRATKADAEGGVEFGPSAAAPHSDRTAIDTAARELLAALAEHDVADRLDNAGFPDACEDVALADRALRIALSDAAAPTPTIRLTSLRDFGTSCPSQWEGRTADGARVHIHYRYGRLSVTVSKPVGGGVYEADGHVFAQAVGDDMDGVMSTDDMLARTRGVIIPPGA